NLGCDDNSVSAITEALSQYSTALFLEDDVVPNPYYYDRMCRLLEAYRPFQKVFSVGAYANFPGGVDELVSEDFMVSRRIFSWGFGTWADRWNSINIEGLKTAYNPFGKFCNVPVTLQTKFTITNQFFLEKNNQLDWCISMTLASLYQDQIHITPMVSFIKNIGFGHPESKTYRGAEADWVNANYDPHACPNTLPTTLELIEPLATVFDGVAVAEYLKSHSSIWLDIPDLWELFKQYPTWSSRVTFAKLFAQQFPTLARRWRAGLPG
ncbi:MAG: sugar transferase, partial [Chroococcales cyanobacterium]